jgi:hypothetical protein
MLVFMESIPQPLTEIFTKDSHILHQILSAYDPLYLKCPSAGYWVTLVRLAVFEISGALFQPSNHFVVKEDSRYRRVAGTQALAHRLDVRDNTQLLPRMESARPSQTTHNLVKDYKRPVSVAYFLHCLEVSLHWSHATQCLLMVG